MSRKKRQARTSKRGSPRGSTQQRIFWVLSLIVALSMVAYFGPVAPQRRSSTPPTLTPTPVVTIAPTIVETPPAEASPTP